ncbi:MAG: dephospho-CoA kinase [bacterium]
MKSSRPVQRPFVRVVGLTGGIGAGKSEALGYLASLGYPVLQADQVGHDLLRDPHFSKRIAVKFGGDILDRRGGVDRRKLGAVVFKSPTKRRALNQLLHPLIRGKIRQWVKKQQKSNPKPALIALEIPLLFEGKGYPYLAGVLSVSASRAVRHRRLSARGWTSEEIRRREKGQWTPAQKDRQAHWVIRNNASRRDLRRRLDAWLDGVLIRDGKRKSGEV